METEFKGYTKLQEVYRDSNTDMIIYKDVNEKLDKINDLMKDRNSGKMLLYTRESNLPVITLSTAKKVDEEIMEKVVELLKGEYESVRGQVTQRLLKLDGVEYHEGEKRNES